MGIGRRNISTQANRCCRQSGELNVIAIIKLRIKNIIYKPLFLRYRNTGVVITVDLSKPQEIWVTLETVIAYLKQRIKECVKEAHKNNSTIKERLKKSIIDRLKGSLVKSNE